LRNREAARYARWAAIVAGLIALSVASVYIERAFRQAQVRHAAPPAVPATVAQRSDQFSFSKVEQDRTIFTVRASHFTQYKDQNRALLEDVWITIYGKDGSRNDNIHTHECSYEPETGDVRCEGEVQIDIGNAKPVPGKGTGPGNTLEVKTSNLSFNRDTGEASTPAPVEFRFPAGQGHGVGVSYSTSDSVVRVEHGVVFDLTPSDKTGGLPVNVSGSSLEIHRTERILVLGGPAIVREGTRELSAEQVRIELDNDYHARRAVAEGHPQIHAAEGGGKTVISAEHLESILNPAGWVERVIADGNVSGTRQTAAGTDHFSASHVEFAMLPQLNLIREMTATGGVTAESQRSGGAQLLKTDALRVTFSAPTAQTSKGAPEQQRIESAETLAPGTIESRSGNDTTSLRAKKFVAQLAAGGRIDKLFGHSGVEVRSQTGNAAPQLISAAELAATFGANGDWDTLDESGDVRFRQADREASAAHGKIMRATDTITLDGSPVISDSVSRTTAANATINQKSGDLRLTGGVVSTYLPGGSSAGQIDTVGFGTGAAHVSADTLSGSVNAGHVTYAGHARLWQGESVLDADQIELWRDDKKLQANGHVVAVFPQASGPFAKPFGPSSGTPGAAPTAASTSGSGSGSGSSSAPTLWRIHAPVLTYWSDQGKAHLEGGVVASSDQGSLESRVLDVFLVGGLQASQGGIAGGTTGQLNRVLAQGNVIVRQGDRRGTAEQGEYTAADGKFVLSGGQPTVTDNSSNSATGHSLTFFVANDTILIDSQEGSRTLTKHRVEK
jgi:LPS export ABC transporter protein LptC